MIVKISVTEKEKKLIVSGLRSVFFINFPEASTLTDRIAAQDAADDGPEVEILRKPATESPD